MYRMSPDGRYLAFGVDTKGSERFDLWWKDMSTGAETRSGIENLHGSLEWDESGSTLFFDEVDACLRPYCIRRLSNLDAGSVERIFEERDKAFHVRLNKKSSILYLISESPSTSETHVITCNGNTKPFLRREEGIRYSIERVDEDRSLLISNKEFRRNGALYLVSQDKELLLLPYEPETSVEGTVVFSSFVAIYGRRSFRPEIRIFRLEGSSLNFFSNVSPKEAIEEPSIAFSFHPTQEQPHGDEGILRCEYSSLRCPKIVYEYDARSGLLRSIRTTASAAHCEEIETETHWISSDDGMIVPFTIAKKKGTVPKGMVITGYGAYGYPTKVDFSAALLPLVNRGIACGIAHARGGGDGGPLWYEMGKKFSKHCTFEDFLACAEYAILRGYTTPQRLAIEGRSAGGLLVAVAINRRPDLFGAAILDVPFVDVLTTLIDDNYSFSANERQEWGDPRITVARDYISSYSPCENVRRNVPYPHMLVIGAVNDPRVRYWEPLKYVSIMRERLPSTIERTLLLKTNMQSGHFGRTGRYERIKDESQRIAFFFHHF